MRHIPSRGDRALIEDALDHLLVQLPKLQQLPKQVIHGDINDLNVLVRDGEVAALIDFGDLIHSWRIAELAIAATYTMLGQDDPLAIAGDVVAGYSEIASVTTAEAEMIYDLIRARLAVSACVAASRAELGNPHHTVSEDDVWELLDRLDYVDAVTARTELARAAGKGFTASPSTLPERRTLALGGALSLSYESSPSGPLHIVRGERSYLYDTMGRRYLDCVNNVAHVGHSHPDVVGAAADQMIMLNTNTRYLHDNVVSYAEQLLDTLPEHLEVVYLVNSGSEANELALRMARAAAQRKAMAVLDHGYHGNTTATVDLSPYKFNGPGGAGRPDWVTVLPLPDPYRPNPELADYRATVDWLLDEREPVAGVIAESIVGCGGQIVPESEHMRAIYDAIHARDGVCIADEVQTGFGRVGSHFWAFQLHDLQPDIVTMGKPIGNGHPLGAVATTFDVAAAFDNGMEYFNTFGGNPVSAAIGLAVLEVIREEELQQNAAEVGGYLHQQLQDLAGRHTAIGDVRGAGLFLGIEFVKDRESREPDAATARHVVDHAKEHGVLLSIDGPHHNVIKIKPPMVFSQANADRLVAAIDTALAAAAG
jgi:4-aminobutyrate aminotransferase-like enzyme